MTSARLPMVTTHPLWSVTQVVGLVLTAVLLFALARWPDVSLHVLWDMIIPLLPAVFLVNPLLWRNVCPLATLNTIGGSRRATPILLASQRSVAGVVGIVLLALMVPARRFLFNEHGMALAVTIAAVAALALVAGYLAPRRSGFCNSLCPVLPVEKLYGQSPLLALGSARCGDCARCTPVGCIDLVGRRSAVQSVEGVRGEQWLLSPFGAFACAFPGFVIGYFTTVNGAGATALGTYGHVGLWSIGSLGLMAAIVRVTHVRASRMLLILGALSAGVYYWFAAPKLANAFGGGAAWAIGVRSLALGLVGFWLWRGVQRQWRPWPQGT
ncbi:MAG: hypothetical protein IPP90_21935 [Gemmatimonadaceae bacterium]|nr:hypothetical protein [Gemmatimonadaceae bacterium]